MDEETKLRQNKDFGLWFTFAWMPLMCLETVLWGMVWTLPWSVRMNEVRRCIPMDTSPLTPALPSQGVTVCIHAYLLLDFYYQLLGSDFFLFTISILEQIFVNLEVKFLFRLLCRVFHPNILHKDSYGCYVAVFQQNFIQIEDWTWPLESNLPTLS
jgi:hypothetical protein